ncbi:MAG: FtsX-like permease family protein [Alphaproteobacteria bacterium]
MKRFELSMAMRYLGSSKKEGFVSLITILSFLGIFLGVTVLILIISFFNGFRHELIKSFIGIDGHISIYGYNNNIQDYDNLIKDVSQIETVVNTRPIIENFSLISFNGNSLPVNIRAYKQDDLKQINEFTDNLDANVIANLNGRTTEEELPHIILGEGIAYKVGVFEPGARISLTSANLTETAFGSVPSSTDFLVTGIFRTGNAKYDDFFALMSFENASWFFNMQDGVNKIDVFTQKVSDAEPTALQIIDKGLEGIYINSWKNNYGSIIGAIDVERNVAFIIVALVIVIAAFSIISSLIMLVNSKIRDIGILRTQGANRKQIKNIFILAGSIIGVVGTLLGVGFGIILSLTAEDIRLFLNKTFHLNLFPAEVFNMPSLPTQIDTKAIIIITIATIILTILASLYPAHKASLIDPAEALKHD